MQQAQSASGLFSCSTEEAEPEAGVEDGDPGRSLLGQDQVAARATRQGRDTLCYAALHCQAQVGQGAVPAPTGTDLANSYRWEYLVLPGKTV